MIAETKSISSSEFILERFRSPIVGIASPPARISERRLKSLGESSKEQSTTATTWGSTIAGLIQLYVADGSDDSVSTVLRFATQVSDNLKHRNDLDHANVWQQLGKILQKQGQFEDAIVQYQRALNAYLASIGMDRVEVALLYKLIGDIYEQQGRFEEASEMYVQTLTISGKLGKSTIHGATLGDLGNKFLAQFERTGSIGDLNLAIKVFGSLSANYQDPIYFAGLVRTLHLRFYSTGSMSDLEEAFAAAERAVEILKVDDPYSGIFLNYMAVISLSQYEQTGESAKLDRAIVRGERAVLSAHSDNPWLAIYLGNLARSLHSRFERDGLMDDLNQAIIANKKAVALTPVNSPGLEMLYNNLSTALQSRFERTGSLEDLNEAIELLSKIRVKKAAIHNNLSAALQRRFERVGSMDDLDRAIALNEILVEETGESDPDHLGDGRWNNLAAALLKRFERTGSIGDLNRALRAGEESLTMVPRDHPNRSVYSYNMAKMLYSRYQHDGSVEDLQRALRMNDTAVSLSPTSHPNYAMYCNSLSNILQSRYKLSGRVEDLERAILVQQTAVEMTSIHHPDLARRLEDLGSVIMGRYEITRSTTDLQNAVMLWQKAVESVASSPSDRIRAAVMASQLLKGSDVRYANSILQTAIHLLPLVSSPTLAESDQRHNISRFAGLTSKAVSISLECGDSSATALQLSELGRGVIAQLQLQIRSHPAALKASYPELGQRFEDLRSQLERKLQGRISSHVIEQFSGILETIRQLPGFERFLLSPTASELSEVARLGPIVVFNISDVRSDAFLVDTQSIRSLRLSRLVYSDLESYTDKFLNATRQTVKSYARNRRILKEVLEWLWDVAVEPILQALGITHPLSDGDQWPRIWWVGSGLLNMLPIHAAGYHESNKNALDRVISTYIPTIKSLAYARERDPYTSALQHQNVALVGMTETPGLRDLPFVREEIAMLQTVIPSQIDVTVIENPTRERVLSALQDHQIVHLACQTSAEADPSKTKLFLHDWEIRPLTVADICTLNTQSAQLAYLSCSNAAITKDQRLLDESINLSSAFLLAGYPAVIGTLWQIRDEQSANVAKDVYSWMCKGQEQRIDHRRAAECLHRAVRLLRDKTRIAPGFATKAQDDPLIWATYIYSGV